MKKYLIFKENGIIIEDTLEELNLIDNNYYKYEFKNNCYILLIEPSNNLNISNIPFIKDEIYGIIKMFKVNNFIEYKIKSLSELFYFKMMNTSIQYIDYSSDDFNPDTCTKINLC